ncbi:MAG: TIR domain-containing protein [Aromatoleum sp.]|nr:TIR domain-containing protein [Aromatoleum sp.]
MSASTTAVFLSYASQDAEAARRICDALRAVGLEVWFDQSALRGGDAWDASIRRQIKECTLFVPIISANTQAREEGYFRREWNLAVGRTLDMADDKAFLLPVVIDATIDMNARVPEKFREVQWTHLPAGEAPAAFAKRVQRLLSGGTAPPLPVAPPRAVPAVASAVATRVNESPSIAVLPFVNMSRDEENEYFADGLSEELLNMLAKIRGLRVASRTSAFSFKGKDVDIPTIAHKLNVATVLEGSVRRSGKRVRITAQLIQVASDSHLWSETYDRELDDIFAVQDDIAQSVVKELRAALLGEPAETGASTAAAAEVRRAAVGRGDDPEAFQLYLQGKFFGERTTQADTDKAIGLFQRALAIDPDFALAWAGLSRVHQTQAGFGFAQIDKGFESAREAAQHALQLAPDLAEAHIELGLVLEGHDWNWTEADASFRRALELAPGDAHALRGAAGLARILGQYDKALELIRRAIALDPLSARTHRQAAMVYLMADRLDDAAAAFQLALDLSPNAGLNHGFLAITRLLQGRGEEALALAEAESHDVFRNLAFAMIHHTLGHPAESDTALQALIDGFGWTAAFQIAEAYAYRGEVEKAYEWLEAAYAQRDPGVAYAAVDVLLRPLHDDSRWQPFLRRIGLA